MRVFIGSEIEEPSEAAFLRILVSDLTRLACDAVIFANFLAGPRRRQIDFVIITERIASVVELKAFTRPVSGDINGQWSVYRADGETEIIKGENPYCQALSTKYALSDAMEQFARRRGDIPIPSSRRFYEALDAALCFYPTVPDGSKIPPGDHKVVILGYPQLLERLTSITLNPGWRIEHWCALATDYLRLHEIAAVENIQESGQRDLREYVERFRECTFGRCPAWYLRASAPAPASSREISSGNCCFAAKTS